ncbi:MAG: 50S ribosomal protein L1 [Pseudomonadaceae bacterium]|nr:50S ribosomal protein L1 [Pseudomonadaceae bacterium]
MAKAKQANKAATPKKEWPVFDIDKAYDLAEAVKLLKSMPSAKFDETVDVALNLGVDPKYNDQNVRGVVALPHGTGKTVRVAVVAKGNAADEAKKAGADIVGDDDLIKQIEGGTINFDRLIATPDCMAMLGKVAKILGPKGLMPNPKLGTVTPTPAKAVKDVKAGQVEFRLEKAGIIHAGVGKKSFTEQQLVENIATLVKAVKDAKPSGAKVAYMLKMSISSTMGKGIKVDLKTAGA